MRHLAGRGAAQSDEDRPGEHDPSLSVTRVGGPDPSLSLPPDDSPRRAAACAAGLAILAALVLFAAPARAGELVPPDPWQIIHVAREFGPAEVTRDGMKDPQIRGTIDGLPYRVNFYGCRLGRDCDTILLAARFWRKEWAEDPPGRKVFAEWNREKLFGRAWRDDEDRAVLDHPVALAGGVPKAALRATFEHWRTALAEYARHLGIR